MKSETVKYFAECNGLTFELIAGICPNCQQKHAGPRRVEFKENSKPHLCNASCICARGPLCSCSCGGKNHGAGFIMSGALFA